MSATVSDREEQLARSALARLEKAAAWALAPTAPESQTRDNARFQVRQARENLAKIVELRAEAATLQVDGPGGFEVSDTASSARAFRRDWVKLVRGARESIESAARYVESMPRDSAPG